MILGLKALASELDRIINEPKESDMEFLAGLVSPVTEIGTKLIVIGQKISRDI